MTYSPPSRRQVLATAPLALLSLTTLGAAPADAARGHRPATLPVRGADISFTLQEEAAGVRFRVGGRVRPVEQVLSAYGASWVRLRVWVDPPDGYSDLASTVALARRARRAGLKVLLDLHYSDFWADPAHQTTPAAWAGQDLPTLAATVRGYTHDVLRTLRRAGVRADMVAVGNEITAGMLWPLGQVYAGPVADWVGFSTLLKAGIAGVRDADRQHGRRTPVMVHIDRGGDNGGSRWFYDHIAEQGVDFDVIGLSYYPFWHGALADLSANLTDLAAAYGKPMVVAETSYPWTMGNGDGLENLLTDAALLPDGDRFPPTPAGQAAYFEALRAVLAAVPGRLGRGFLAWEPEWLPGVGWEPGAGNPNDNLTMFDWTGTPLPSMRAFRPGR